LRAEDLLTPIFTNNGSQLPKCIKEKLEYKELMEIRVFMRMRLRMAKKNRVK